MVVEVFRMMQEDIPMVAQLERRCFSTPWSEESLGESLRNPSYRFYVVKDEGKVIGYIGTYMVADELNITNIAVDPGYRRQGIGWSLLETAINLAQNGRLSTVFLEVRASNEAAIAMYRKAGFESAGLRKNFYTDPTEDGRIMRLYLD